MVISRLSRSRRKFVTVVTGLDKHNINLKAAAKKFRQKFACGATVLKSTQEVEIQGDVTYEMAEFLLEAFDVLTKYDIGFGEDGRKRK